MFCINSTARYNKETGEGSVDGIVLTEDQVNAIATLHADRKRDTKIIGYTITSGTINTKDMQQEGEYLFNSLTKEAIRLDE